MYVGMAHIFFWCRLDSGFNQCMLAWHTYFSGAGSTVVSINVCLHGTSIFLVMARQWFQSMYVCMAHIFFWCQLDSGFNQCMFAWHTYFSGAGSTVVSINVCLHGTHIFLVPARQYWMFAWHTYFSGASSTVLNVCITHIFFWCWLDGIGCLHGTSIFLVLARQYWMFAWHTYFSGI